MQKPPRSRQKSSSALAWPCPYTRIPESTNEASRGPLRGQYGHVPRRLHDLQGYGKQGYSSEQLEQALTAVSPELLTLKLGHDMDYCQRTVRAVFADKEVQQELQRRHAKSLSRVGPTHSL